MDAALGVLKPAGLPVLVDRLNRVVIRIARFDGRVCPARRRDACCVRASRAGYGRRSPENVECCRGRVRVPRDSDRGVVARKEEEGEK